MIMPSIDFTQLDCARRTLQYVPCFRCASRDVQIFMDYGLDQPTQGGGRCKSCSNAVVERLGISPIKNDCVDIWNAQNDPALLTAAYTQIIEAGKQQIAAIHARSDELNSRK
jgi:hypothetical protein